MLEPGDIVIDGGNTNWQLAMKDAEGLKAKGMHYLDAGTSGGVWGLENGYGLMVGGEDAIFEHCKPLLTALAPPEGGLVHCGPEGSGHFVKMVHNGIEYGLMQAYGEGFEILKKSKAFPGMDLQAIAEAWRYGTVVRSWLLDLIAIGLKEDPELASLTAYVEDTGEGRWTVQAAIDEDVPAFTITHSLFERFRSRDPKLLLGPGGGDDAQAVRRPRGATRGPWLKRRRPLPRTLSARASRSTGSSTRR